MNFEMLLAIMKSKGVRKNMLEGVLGLKRKTLWKRFKGELEFKRDEIVKIRDFLELTDEQLIQIFFTRECLKSYILPC